MSDVVTNFNNIIETIYNNFANLEVSQGLNWIFTDPPEVQRYKMAFHWKLTEQQSEKNCCGSWNICG